MKNKEKIESDILRQYIDAEKIEKAPKGFTSRIMSQALLEAEPLKQKKNNHIPAISALVTTVFIMIAVLIPGSSHKLNVPDILQNISIPLPGILKNWFSGFHPPEILLYIVAGCFILTILDAALYGFFNRQNSDSH